MIFFLCSDQHCERHPRHNLERAAQGERGRQGRRHPRGHRSPDGRRHVEEAAQGLHPPRGQGGSSQARRSASNEHLSQTGNRSDAKNFDYG
jgi:hypothetical protein